MGGLIGDVSVPATIQNSTVAEGATINGSGAYVGGAVGYVAADLTVNNTTVLANVIGSNATGGFIGQAKAAVEIKASTLGGSVTGGTYAGGYIGHLTGASATIYGCSVSKDLLVSTSGSFAGGFVGYSDTSGTLSIGDSVMAGDVTNTGRTVGGFVGCNDAGTTLVIDGCAMTGTVYQGLFTGGYVGKSYGTSNTIKNSTVGIKNSEASYVFTDMNGQWVGGFIADAMNLNMEACINYAPVTHTGYYEGRIAGFVAYFRSGNLTMDGCLNFGNISFGTPETPTTAGNGTIPCVAGLLSGASGNVTCPEITVINSGNEGTIYLNDSTALGTWGGLGGLISGLSIEGDTNGVGNLTVENCYNSGTIDYNANVTGGLSVAGIVSNLYTRANVKLNKLFSTGSIINRQDIGAASLGLITAYTTDRNVTTMTNSFGVFHDNLPTTDDANYQLASGQIYGGNTTNNAIVDSADSEITILEGDTATNTTMVAEIAKIRDAVTIRLEVYDPAKMSLKASADAEDSLSMALRVKEPFGFMAISSVFVNGEAVEFNRCYKAEIGFIFLATAEPLTVEALVTHPDAVKVAGETHANDPYRFVARYENMNVSNIEQTVYFVAYIYNRTTETYTYSDAPKFLTPYVEVKNGANGAFSTGAAVEGAEQALYQSIVDYKTSYNDYLYAVGKTPERLNEFDVLTYNIACSIKENDKADSNNLNDIVDYLATTGAEVMILNEIDINSARSDHTSATMENWQTYKKTGFNQPKYIAEQLTEKTGIQHYWAFMVGLNGYSGHSPAFTIAAKGASLDVMFSGGWIDEAYTSKYQALYGEALITTYPIESFEQVRFMGHDHAWSADDGSTQVASDGCQVQVIAVAEINVNGTLVSVLPEHYGWTANDNIIGAERVIEEYLKDIEGPVILAGDLNNNLKYATGRYDKEIVDKTLPLLMQYLNITITQDNVPITFRHNETGELRTPDYIFVSDDFTVTEYPESDMTQEMSDHFPLYCRVAMS